MTIDERIAAALERQAQVLEKLEQRLAAGTEELITMEEAARRLGGCSVRTVWRHVHAGRLVAKRHGKRTHVTAESVSAMNGAAVAVRRG